ncbi:SDR family NAD(P)-dependent oxidoreductase, partial [Pseudomonas sp. SIMBA_059]
MPQPKNYNATMAGKVAIVTGAGAEGDGIGIGRAIAVVLAGEGAKVCLVDLDAQRAQDTLKQIESMGAEAFVISANVTLRDDCARIVEETMS